MPQPLERGSASTRWADPAAQVLASLHLCGFNHGPSGTVDCELRIAAIISLDMRSHEWIDERSLALHEAVAARLEAQPQLLEVARANLQRWLAARPVVALREWQRLLDSLPLPQLVQLLRSPEEEAARLRQSSPFAGILSPAERQAILARYESSRA
jgi:hypothetical protein